MKMHIFFTDDDRDELKIFLEAMAGVISSFKCTYATNGEQAIEMLKYLTPDFIFIDYDLPGTNGIEILEAVKKVERLKDIPFFLYSNYMTDQMRGEAIAAGASGCIQKPGSISELTEELRDVFQPAARVQVA